jgi:hypothetical protein
MRGTVETKKQHLGPQTTPEVWDLNKFKTNAKMEIVI